MFKYSFDLHDIDLLEDFFSYRSKEWRSGSFKSVLVSKLWEIINAMMIGIDFHNLSMLRWGI